MGGEEDIKKLFEGIDSDENGFITLAEWNNFESKHGEKDLTSQEDFNEAVVFVNGDVTKGVDLSQFTEIFQAHSGDDYHDEDIMSGEPEKGKGKGKEESLLQHMRDTTLHYDEAVTRVGDTVKVDGRVIKDFVSKVNFADGHWKNLFKVYGRVIKDFVSKVNFADGHGKNLFKSALEKAVNGKGKGKGEEDIEKLFEGIDSDENGFINLAEWNNFESKHGEKDLTSQEDFNEAVEFVNGDVTKGVDLSQFTEIFQAQGKG